MSRSPKLPRHHVPRATECNAFNDACYQAGENIHGARLKVLQHFEAPEPLGKTTLCHELAQMCACSPILAGFDCSWSERQLDDFVAALVRLRNDMCSAYPEAKFVRFDMGLYGYLTRFRPMDANSAVLVGSSVSLRDVFATSIENAGEGLIDKLVEELTRSAPGAVGAGVVGSGAMMAAHDLALSLSTIWAGGMAAGATTLVAHTSLLMLRGLRQRFIRDQTLKSSPELALLLREQWGLKIGEAEDVLVRLLAQDLNAEILRASHPVMPVFIVDDAVPSASSQVNPLRARWRRAIGLLAMELRGAVIVATSHAGQHELTQELKAMPTIGALECRHYQLTGLEENAVTAFLEELGISEEKVAKTLKKLRAGGPHLMPARFAEWCRENVNDAAA